METQQPNWGGLLSTVIKLPWYVFILGVKTVFKAVEGMKVPEKRPEIEEHRMSQTGASEQAIQQMV